MALGVLAGCVQPSPGGHAAAAADGRREAGSGTARGKGGEGRTGELQLELPPGNEIDLMTSGSARKTEDGGRGFLQPHSSLPGACQGDTQCSMFPPISKSSRFKPKTQQVHNSQAQRWRRKREQQGPSAAATPPASQPTHTYTQHTPLHPTRQPHAQPHPTCPHIAPTPPSRPKLGGPNTRPRSQPWTRRPRPA